jgi:hypothetical protein
MTGRAVTVVRQKRRGIAPAVVPTEHQEQAALFRWAELEKGKYPDLEWLYAIPNFPGNVGGFVARINAGKRAKAEGRKKGYPDIGLDVRRGGYCGLRIELKRVKGGSVSPEQKVWRERLESQGLRVEVCKGWEAARAVLLDYLQTA